MKRIITTIILLAICIVSFAQGTSKVILKNGTTLTGKVVELNPVSHVTIIVAGLETRINISDVQSIEDATLANSSSSESPRSESGASLSNTGSAESDLPETITYKIGGRDIEMILIKGGTFMMGFDGHNSLRYRSEPVHEVELSSFYINKEPLTYSDVDRLAERNGISEDDLVAWAIKRPSRKNFKKRGNEYYRDFYYRDALTVIKMINDGQDISVRFISEAEWEYVFASDRVLLLSGIKDYLTFPCMDYYAPYPNSPSKDPAGPRVGDKRVVRIFYGFNNEENYSRHDIDDLTDLVNNNVKIKKGDKSYWAESVWPLDIRFVIPASQISKP